MTRRTGGRFAISAAMLDMFLRQSLSHIMASFVSSLYVIFCVYFSYFTTADPFCLMFVAIKPCVDMQTRFIVFVSLCITAQDSVHYTSISY